MNTAFIELLAIFGLVLANGFFAASEFALIASRKSRIKDLADKGDSSAARTYKLLDRPDRFLAAIQVGITFVATLAGVFGGATMVDRLSPLITMIPISFFQNSPESIAIVVVVLGITFLSVVIGELVPKYIALGNPEKIALKVTGPITIFCRMTSVIVGFLTFSARSVLRIFGKSVAANESQISEDEINILIKEGTESGVFDKTEQRLIKSVFDFSDITARMAMTPRVDLITVKLGSPIEEIMEIMTSHGYSRYPVYETSSDEIVGVVYTKDLIALMVHEEMIILRDIIRKPLYVPDSMLLSVLMEKFQKQKIHIAIVLDEFGGTAGLITLEDILEEIVGDIQDEHDTAQPEFVLHSEKVAFAAGALRPDELNELFNVDIPEDISDTLAGLVVEQLNKSPQISDEVRLDDLTFSILEMDGIRIKRLRVTKTK